MTRRVVRSTLVPTVIVLGVIAATLVAGGATALPGADSGVTGDTAALGTPHTPTTDGVAVSTETDDLVSVAWAPLETAPDDSGTAYEVGPQSDDND